MQQVTDICTLSATGIRGPARGSLILGTCFAVALSLRFLASQLVR